MKKLLIESLFIGLCLSFSNCGKSEKPSAIATNQSSLERLMAGNDRYVKEKPIYPNQEFSQREKMTQGQHPFAIIVGCSDSRVPPELIFDQGLGDLFVVRVAGNIVGPVELDSIEYAADNLSVPLILILGHQNCGAVTAVLTKDPALVQDIENIVPFIQPAVDASKNMPGNALENAIKMNVELVISHLKSTPIIGRLFSENKLQIVGGYYSLDDGRVQILKDSPKI